MSWLKLKTWFLANRLEGSLAIFFLFSVLLLGGLVWYSWGNYDAASSEYISKSSELAILSRKKPFPDASNLSRLKETLSWDQADLDKLNTELLRYRIQPMGDLEKSKPQDWPQLFQDALREEVTKVKSLATNNGSTLPPTFYLGLDDFENKPPQPDQALLLAKQLTVLAWVAETLLNHQSVVVGEFSRPVNEAPAGRDTTLPNNSKKSGPTSPDQRDVLTPYSGIGSASLVFSCSQTTLREFINALSSPSAPYFVLIDNLQLQNTAKEPPKRVDMAAPETLRQSAGKEHPPARIPILVGRENLNISMKIRILEFQAPSHPTPSMPSKTTAS